MEGQIVTFIIQSQKSGKMEVQFEVKPDIDFIGLLFQSVHIRLPMVVGNERFELPLIPKIKDAEGNVHCILDEEGELVFALMKSHRNKLYRELKQKKAAEGQPSKATLTVIQGGKHE